MAFVPLTRTSQQKGVERIDRPDSAVNPASQCPLARAQPAGQAERTQRQANAHALAIARTIAQKPPRSAELAKAAVLAAFQTTLDAGLEFERQAIRHAFTTQDYAEGMNAFFEKREANYRGT